MDPTRARYTVQSVDKLWRSVLETRRIAKGPLFTVDILSPSEYQNIITNDALRAQALSAGVLSGGAFYAHLASGVLGETRPFVGEELYRLAAAHQGLLGRLCAFLEQGEQQGYIGVWYEDELMKAHIAAALNAEEIQQFENLERKTVGWLSNLLESKIANKLQEVLPS